MQAAQEPVAVREVPDAAAAAPRRVALALSLALVLDAAVLSSRVQTTDSIENWVSDTLRTMTLDQKIGQVVMVGVDAGIDSDRSAFEALSRAVVEFHVSGIVQRGVVSSAVESLRARARVGLLIVAISDALPEQELGLLEVRATPSMRRQLAAGNAASRRQAIVQALVEGHDLLFDTPDAEEAFWAIGAAIERGEIPLERLEHSVARVLRAKARIGLIRVL